MSDKKTIILCAITTCLTLIVIYLACKVGFESGVALERARIWEKLRMCL